MDVNDRANTAPIANESEASYVESLHGPYEARLWRFSFGAYGDTHVFVWERSLDDALETAGEWLAENAPGLFQEPDYADAAEDLGREWNPAEPDDEIIEKAEVDLTYTEAGWLASWEWWVDEITDPLLWYAIRMRSDLELVGAE